MGLKADILVVKNKLIKNSDHFFESQLILKSITTLNNENYLIETLFESIVINNLIRVRNLFNSNSLDVKCLIIGWNPLLLAAIEGRDTVVKTLLDFGADIDTTDGFTHLQRRAQIDSLGQFNYFWRMDLIDYSHLLSGLSCRGSTALHYAVIANSRPTVELLIKCRADPNIIDDNGYRAIDYVSEDNPVMKQLLFDYEMLVSRRVALRRIKQLIVGQENAINIVFSTIRRKENGWFESKSPLVFLFMGSSGVGKTELAKQIVEYMKVNDENIDFIRIDMSEYQEWVSITKLIGSSPGYVGYDEGGQLTNALIKCPNAMVLFDEVEKAHKDVLTILLQLFDEGRLTDSFGQSTDCKDAVFIMTSNLATNEIANYALQYRSLNMNPNVVIKESREFKDLVVQPILKRHFQRDEFLGRINEFVYFWPFSDSELVRLVTQSLESWARLAISEHNITLSWNRSVIELIADEYNISYGARSIKYAVDREIVNKLSLAQECLLIRPGDRVNIAVDKQIQTNNGFIDKRQQIQTLIKLQLINKIDENYIDIELPSDII